MKNIINIIHVVQNAGRSKKTGNDYDMRMGQCVIELTDENGAPAPLIGELLLPKQFQDITPGRYEVEFKISVGNDKRVGAVVASMVPVGATRAPAAAPAAKA
jgi:hypothetical protein